MKIFVINPGGGSTKLGYFENEKEIFIEKVYHSPEELKKFETIEKELEYRKKLVENFIEKKGIDFEVIVSRGGAFMPLESGTYLITEKLVKDVLEGKVQAQHPSNFGVLIAWEIAKKRKIEAYFVDPVCVDEFIDEARISGIPELERKSLLHALNVRYVSHLLAKEVGKDFNELNLVVAHLGTGITIASIRKGRIIDVNNANDGGPFSPQRAGTLPTTGLIKLCFSGKFTEKQLIKYVTKQAGLLAYLGKDMITEIEKDIEKGDKKADLIYRAMIYQIAKEIGAYATALKGKVDYIVITGGMAISNKLVEKLKEYINYIAPIKVYPGEHEMEALVAGVLRVKRGEEKPKKYEEVFKEIT